MGPPQRLEGGIRQHEVPGGVMGSRVSSIPAIGAALAFGSVLSACGEAPAEPRRQESYEELIQRQQADFAALPDMQVPELRQRLRALGVADGHIKPATDDYGEQILLITLDDAEFARIDKRALAKLQFDSRHRLGLTQPDQGKSLAVYSVAETHVRDKARALRELAEKGETDRIPRYQSAVTMQRYAEALESYCGYRTGEALRVVDGEWLDYTQKMASDAAVAASNRQSFAPFACVKRVVDATDLHRHFIGNRGSEGAIDY
jgi:hypothetical protein